MARHRNLANEADIFSAGTHQQLIALGKATRALRDKMPGLHKSLRVPIPRGGGRYEKSSRTAPSVFTRAGEAAFGNLLSADLLPGIGLTSGSFYASSSQLSSSWLQAIRQGQRIS